METTHAILCGYCEELDYQEATWWNAYMKASALKSRIARQMVRSARKKEPIERGLMWLTLLAKAESLASRISDRWYDAWLAREEHHKTLPF